ncbi:MAG TPA: hypothetical protein VMB84_12920 [Stellaceae bacterium]|nr:hypothetical protein [Stellaceae bacterium]
MSRIPIASIVVGLLLGSALAWARPPEGANDPVLHAWFESLKQPGTNYSCCSIADCRPTEYRLSQTGYEAYLDDHWIAVPDDKVLTGQTNPTGRAVVCRSPANGSILCFVPASET